MASTRQIENLERKHRENPEGFTFAPLANAYRNSGQPERAIEILTQGLEHHPEHAPARIVLGRCHVDLGDDAAAESAFTQVLELDQENVVALKALADITERNDRPEETIRWLNYLLEVDRNNDEAREQLERVTRELESRPPAPAEEEMATGSGESETDPVAEAAAGEILRDEPFVPPAAGGAGDSILDLPDEASPGAEAEPVAEAASQGTAPNPWAHPLAGAAAAPETPEADEVATMGEGGAEVAGEPDEAEEEPQPVGWEPPGLSPEAVPPVAEETPAAEVLGGPGSTWFEAENSPPEESGLGGLEDGPDDLGLEVVKGEEIELRPSQENEFQVPDGAAGLSLSASEGSEYQPDSAADHLTLRGSDENEFQTPSAAESLGLAGEGTPGEDAPDDAALPTPSAWESPGPAAEDTPEEEEDAGDAGATGAVPPIAEEAEESPAVIDSGDTVQAYSWFSPAESDLPVSDPLAHPAESQPDGTAEPLEADLEGEPAAGEEVPFEEDAPALGAWSPMEEPSEVPLPPESTAPGVEAREAVASGGTGDTDGPGDSGRESPSLEVRDLEIEEEDEHPVEVAGEPVLADGEENEEPAGAVGFSPETRWEAAPEMAAEEQDREEEEAESGLVVTETMAELYLSQGHRYEALGVYRMLAARSPDDPRLSQKVEALTAEVESGRVSAVDELPEEAVTAARSASMTGNQSVKSFFRGVLSAGLGQAEGESPAAPALQPESTGQVVGEPTRPAQDHLSLSAVFGEDASPVPPAVAGTGEGDEASGEGFSFDSFFGGEGDAADRPSGGGRRARSAEDEEDLDQFNAWLQGLKG